MHAQSWIRLIIKFVKIFWLSAVFVKGIDTDLPVLAVNCDDSCTGSVAVS